MKQKSILLWVLLVLMAVMVYQSASRFSKPQVSEIAYGTFREQVRKGYVESVEIKGGEIQGQYKAALTDQPEDFDKIKSKSFSTYWVGTGDELTRFLESNGVSQFEASNDEKSGFWQYVAGQALVMIIISAVMLFFLMKALQAGSGKALSFGKSKAKLQSENKTKVTFADVAGVDESKEELQEIIDFLKEPKKFTKLGGRIPKGVLLVGSPGTGKTLLAKAIAGEAGVPFFSISGSDFVEMFVGVGASRVRDLFEQAKKSAPCIVFIDEIDAVGRHRGAGLGGGHDEREQTLNQLLVEMDGFDFNEGVILVAATNRPDVLDPALLRPGRFDRHVVVPRPDVKGRVGILKVHTKKVPMDKNVQFETLAKGTAGFTGADLENMVNEAALLAVRMGQEKVTMDDFEMAKDKIMLGKERKTMVISEKEKEVTSYHEAGHTLVASKLPGADRVHKVTIIPRGMALGLTHQLPEEDTYTLNQENAETTISILMGGRVAEEVVFGKKTNGAGNDIERATDLSRKMVCEWGMSEKLGPLTFGQKEHEVFLAMDISHRPNYSERTAQLIDEEIQSIVHRNYKRAQRVITENRSALDRLAKALLEFETLDGVEIKALIEGKSVDELKAHIEGRLKKEPKEPKFSGRASFEIYRNIAKTAPNYSRLDEVLFLAGFHSMEINSPDAGPYFERLIKEFPKSKFLVDAHMELGEFYFQKRELDKAQANFQAVLKADNSLRNFALYKIGWCYYNRGNTKAAMKIMQRVVSSSKGVKSELELRGEALKDLIIFYSDLGLIDEARRYFTAIGEPAYARKVLERLAEIYFEQSRYEKAIEALQKLIAMEPTHPDVPRHHSRLIESYEKSEELERAMREMQVFIQSYKPGTPWYERNTDSSVREYAYNRSEGLARFLAQKYHELAQKAESKNKPASDKYTQMALQFYESYIQQFGSHKNAAEMRFLFAQLLLKNKVYAKAADQYEWIVKNDKKTPKYKDALIGLIDSLRALEDDQYKKISEGLRKNINEKATPSPYALRLLNAYNIFIARYSRDERVPDIMLNRAQIYYNYNHFDKAKPAFGQVIQKFRDHSAAHQARHAILDMYNLLKDWENLEKIASQFLKVSSFATDQNKKLLYEIIQGSIFQRAKDYEDKKQYLEAAKTYERLLSLYPTSKYSDKALFNASINYLNADENDKAIATSKKFIKTYPKSDLVPKLILALATNFDDRMDYEHAAEYYEILASQDPKSKLAPDALFNAGLYREQLKHYSIAVNNYETYLKRYPKSKDAAETAFSLGVVYEKMKAYSKAVDVFKSFPRRYPRERARIVEAYYRLGDNLNKLRDYGPAERAWKNGAAYGRKYRTGTHYAAKSQFELTKPVLREFNAVKLRMPQSVLTRAIERKANLLKNLKDSYLKIINMGDAEVGVAALYHIGYVYQDFSAALFGAPMPKGLKDNEIQIYQQELQSRAAPIEEKAIEAYENAFKKSQELQVYSTWTIKTYDALTQYKPSQYPARQGEADIVWVHNEPFARVVQKAGPPQKPDGNAKRNKVDFEELPRLRVSSARAFESAFNKSRSAIASNARNFQAYVVLGQAYFQLGEYAKAKNSFENALLVKPDRDDIKLELAKAAIEAGDSKLSLQIYRDLLKKDPDNWTLKNNLSIAYRKIRHFKSATALIREMLSSDKFHIYAINNLGLLYHDTRRYELAELTFQKGKKSNPDTAETYNNLGLTYLAMDMPSNAITEFKRAVELDRKLASAWMNLGNIYLKHANAQEAVRAYEKVVSIDPVSFEANQNLGVAYMSMKKTDKAKDAFENVLAINSNHGPALFNLGILYHQYEKNREKALEYYTRFINTQRGKLPKNHEVYAYIKQVKMMPVKTQETGTKGNK